MHMINHVHMHIFNRPGYVHLCFTYILQTGASCCTGMQGDMHCSWRMCVCSESTGGYYCLVNLCFCSMHAYWRSLDVGMHSKVSCRCVYVVVRVWSCGCCFGFIVCVMSWYLQHQEGCMIFQNSARCLSSFDNVGVNDYNIHFSIKLQLPDTFQ